MPTKIVIKATDVSIPALLNDSVAAQEFKKRLPYKISGRRYDIDYCCKVAYGVFDPLERKSRWENGDIALESGWLNIFFAGENEAKCCNGIMIIANIKKEHLELVRGLPDNVKFLVELLN